MCSCISSIYCRSSGTVSGISGIFKQTFINVFTRWLLALVKSGKTLRACPRCFTLTTQFRELSLPETNFLRTSSDMRNLCHLGRELLSNSDSAVKGEELFKYYSMHNIQVFNYHYLGIIFAKQLNVQNAFWELPQPFFDIHGSMLVDELHNLGGCIVYLLNCLDALISDTCGAKSTSIINEINTRASQIPAYKDHRRFNNGLFPRFLKNPTFTEIRSLLTIVLPCCHDYIPLQASLCLRHFLDFVMHATAKEHTEKSLAEMDESLAAYYKYSPIFEKYSPTRLNFPKNHMLQKYANDIRSRGMTSGYTTCNAERQHIIDVKKPAKQTNRRFDSLVQMANYVQKKDLLFDTAASQPNSIESLPRVKTSIQKIQAKRYKLTHTLGSPANDVDVSELKKQPIYSNVDKVIRSYFGIVVEKWTTRVAARNMAALDSNVVKVY